MTKIELCTLIDAPLATVFDAARNIDLHMSSAKRTKEIAIAGKTSGLINLYETVTWKGKHFGLYLKHQSKITSLKYPTFFIDEMIHGHFKSFKHQHIFKETITGTKMIDLLEYETPYGFLGRFFDRFFLKNHLTKFLSTRNQHIKTETEQSTIR
ncbi:SRPBCC family protein [uncultured Aquimarina sp.]|jgi:ligand-binding SRPBCC domain-containing protein|uniref:SRPBCC family protein n=1 Tax=uncultured Aquimarina sp. TaxID=575652 RepID=UPI0026392A1B|nr:SRPBCC family protein [uncultured Aquimarina sp.]